MQRAITADEHRRIPEREGNPERRAFYELCWHLARSGRTWHPVPAGHGFVGVAKRRVVVKFVMPGETARAV